MYIIYNSLLALFRRFYMGELNSENCGCICITIGFVTCWNGFRWIYALNVECITEDINGTGIMTFTCIYTRFTLWANVHNKTDIVVMENLNSVSSFYVTRYSNLFHVRFFYERCSICSTYIFVRECWFKYLKLKYFGSKNS